MSDTIKSVVNFSGMAVGATATLPHGLIINALRLKPDSVRFQFPGFQLVSADTIGVTIKNIASPGGGLASHRAVLRYGA